MRTLLISDLHLGVRRGNDVARRPEALRALLAALTDIDRLVLLGDIVELGEGRAQRAMEIAAPTLEAIGDQLGSEREVVLVPGNHDRALVRRWALAQGKALRVDSEIPLQATTALEHVAALLGPARITVRYPGVWLSPRIWATHGHYIDRYLVPASPIGFRRRWPRGRPEPTSPAGYERRRRPSLSRSTGWLPPPLATLLDDLAELARAAVMPGPQLLLHRRFARLNTVLLSAQMRWSALPALAHVVQRLGVDAEFVVFGHVHRLGPLPGEDRSPWQGPTGRPQLCSSGSWLYEPVLIHNAQPPHPYWPGGALVIDDDGPPRPIGLLDHLPESALVDDQVAVAELVPQVTRG